MDVLVAGQFAPPPPTQAELAAQQLRDHLGANYKIQGQVYAYGGVALLRCGDLTVWVHSGRYVWSTGTLDPAGRPVCATVPMNQAAVVAGHVAERYHHLRGLAGPYAVRIG